MKSRGFLTSRNSTQRGPWQNLYVVRAACGGMFSASDNFFPAPISKFAFQKYFQIKYFISVSRF